MNNDPKSASAEELATKGNLLIVDDTPDNLRLLSAMLAEQGYEVRKAINGKMALIAVQADPPELILLDIMMPGMNGYQVCEKLKASKKTAEIPVIFLSALDDANDKVKAFAVGGVDYITKPFQFSEVLARVENHLTIIRLQKQLQEKNLLLEQLNGELERSNSDLEQFAYIVSHDLQAPLQGIVGSADMLSWKYENVLGADGDRYVNQIVDAAFRMKNLIQDLLAYSRVGKGSLDFQPNDCQEILEEVLSNLQADIDASGATISYEDMPDMPIAIGNKTQLIQLFQNTLSNAIKFRRPEVTPEIKILATLQSDRSWLFSISDNGIGIASQNLELIFEIFQRLHKSDDYPGTGIGMTICKKIVELHGGKIWVESKLDRGTTVFFTLPSELS
ncbi:MAG: response regulator [Oscillatoria sp. SIO1A7]|nr:response regulator [Oscillatoria sp. SIO1A7]